ncbi:AtzE family amidohydrolase [Noviherbaspirillum pedocola]|uniref:AtzE family amidohydrolase n=1 Tax=Noviherbaspirillum pedocola TaxID=2801341 RepID=A0A934W1H8_9BURK|nr:AtzE family amidohydrolase [Noviherbaspirillum pedocola]MBK4735191.1 AtzE family amidohydrolase [Noviherbaspirillum pedocola]
MMRASDIARAVADGSLLAVDALRASMERIERLDPALNCFTSLTEERAWREAAEIDARRARGEALPPLAGVPYAVKNLFDIEGEVTLAGGAVNRGNAPAARDAVLVERMRAAGAVLVGALNMDEHAYGFTTENSHFGPTRNPRDTTRSAGGSSGGSAAAVAAGMVPISLGSDTNGSIRVPASLCGIFGLKPTFGRLPRAGSFPFVHSLDHLGPFAANAQDLSLAYDALLDAPRSSRIEQGIAHGLRVAVLGGWFEEWASGAACEAVAQVSHALGATRKLRLAGAEKARAAAFVITGAEGGALHRRRLIERYDEYEPLSRDRLIAGSLIPAGWVAQAQRVRRMVYEEALDLFEDIDLLIAPATPVPATPLGSEEMEINGRRVPTRASMGLLTQPISCIGLPVCAVPVWPAQAGGLPVGVQLIAPPWREDVCLAAARVLEAAGLCAAPPHPNPHRQTDEPFPLSHHA